MSKSTSSASAGGMSAMGLLGIVFVVLKLFGLTDVATWSWWLVLAPFWAPLVIVLAILGIVAVAIAIAASK